MEEEIFSDIKLENKTEKTKKSEKNDKLEERISYLEKSERHKKIFDNKSPDFSETENLFSNLDVLCSVKAGQKLYVNQNLISTDHVYLRKISEGLKTSEDKSEEPIKTSFGINSILRWYLSESRTNTLKKIRTLIKDAIICGYLAVESFENSFSDISGKTVEELNNLLYVKRWEIVRTAVIAPTNKEVLVKLVSIFNRLIPSLENIKLTYNDDTEFVSLMCIEIALVQNTITEFGEYIKCMDNTI